MPKRREVFVIAPQAKNVVDDTNAIVRDLLLFLAVAKAILRST